MLTEQQVKTLLAYVVAYDNRNPGQAAIQAWAEASRRGKWTFDEAADAIHAHYATETTWLMPGHITARIKAGRPVHTMSAGGPAPDQLGQRRVAEIVGGVRSVDDPDPRPLLAPPPPPAAIDTACPHCLAEPGKPCTRPGRRPGEQLARSQSHPSRAAAAS